MLQIEIPETEFFDSRSQEFIKVPATSLKLEHSLISISKWESKWNKPFLSDQKKTYAQSLDYVRCMTISPVPNDSVYLAITSDMFAKINAYIQAPMTATWFSQKNNKPSRQVITSELIYYWMVALEIPFQCQKWHLNRLLTLIRVCNLKNKPAKKMGKQQILSRNRSLNAARKSKMHTKG